MLASLVLQLALVLLFDYLHQVLFLHVHIAAAPRLPNRPLVTPDAVLVQAIVGSVLKINNWIGIRQTCLAVENPSCCVVSTVSPLLVLGGGD